MINVVCVKVGNKYADEYVINLRNAVKKHLSIPHKFICITEAPLIGLEDVEYITPPHYLKGWWNKLYLFCDFNGITGTIMYLDLDQIIVGSLDKFVEMYETDKSALWMIKDFSYIFDRNHVGGNSSVMIFDRNTHLQVWDNYTPDQETVFGDQKFIYENTKVAFFPLPWVKSWKWQVIKGGIVGFYYTRNPIYKNKIADVSETSIICFHGKPDPDEIDDLVPFWRGEVADLKSIAKVSMFEDIKV